MKTNQKFSLKMQIFAVVAITMLLQSCSSYSYADESEPKEVKAPIKKNLNSNPLY